MITKSSAQLVAAVGRHNAVPDSAFDPAELKRGREVEHEHNDKDPEVQNAIAKDHLAEIPDYYTRLDKMEAAGKAALKKEAEDYQYGSLQLDLTGDLRDKVLRATKKIKTEDLAEDGRETNPHCTVLYGLHETAAPSKMPVLGMFGPISLRLGPISIFSCKGYDVVKVEVISPALTQMNWILRRLLPHTSTHPEYHPHITLAYVKKGKGKAYEAAAHDLFGSETSLNTVQHCTQSGTKTPFALTGYKMDSHVLEKLHTVLKRPSRAMTKSASQGPWQKAQAEKLKRSVVAKPKVPGKSFNGVALKKDNQGFYVSTHRARSKSYPTAAAIPNSKIKFIKSTG